MAENYFEISQRVKREIASLESMLIQARQAFDGQLEYMTAGGTVELYSMGVLPSGLYVALRILRKDTDEGKEDLTNQKRMMENYCKNAEDLHNEGKNVPKFCVGVEYKESTGIFTEDLTAGGTQEFEHNSDDAYGFVGTGENRRMVYVDIDLAFKRTPWISIRYFSDENVIQL